MVTEAQKRANAAYRKKSVKQLTVRFYPGDEDEAMYAWLKSKENTTEYLKALVRADMGENEFEEMAKDEMRRFLAMEAEDGKTKEEALQRLIDLLGIKWPGEGRG